MVANWNGLMWDYYVKRWETYIRELTVGMISGQDIDNDKMRSTIDKYQERWVTSTDEPICGYSDLDILTHSRQLRDKYREQLLQAFQVRDGAQD